LVIINGLYAIAVIISHHLPFNYIFYNGLVKSLPHPSFHILKEVLYPMAKILENKELFNAVSFGLCLRSLVLKNAYSYHLEK
jgi:hypothetical protein